MITTIPHPALAPVDLGALHLSNRIVMAPMTRVSTHGDGVPTARMARYYAEHAEGGFGLVITEGTYTDGLASQGYVDQPGLVTARQTEGWGRVVAGVHAAGGRILAQLMHAGALSQCLKSTLAPSAIRPQGRKMPEYKGEGAFPMPRAMDDDDIAAAIAGFAAAAGNAAAAGFDGVEIHGANGYLLDQFLTDYTNQRVDRYGGDVRARIAFTCGVVRAVKSAVPEGFLVGLRLSQTKVNDLEYRWPGRRADGEIIFAATAAARVDLLHLASEGRDWLDTADLGGVTITKLARAVAGVPVIANGGMHDPERARMILTNGHGDMVALARGAIANPDWPRRLANGTPFEVFDSAMIHPLATIQNTDAWRAQQVTASSRKRWPAGSSS